MSELFAGFVTFLAIGLVVILIGTTIVMVGRIAMEEEPRLTRSDVQQMIDAALSEGDE